MNALIIIGSMVVGGGLGWCGGILIGFNRDTSDFPMLPVFTAPAGAAIGVALAGAVAAVVVA